MQSNEALAQEFERNREMLLAVAYRMLGSRTEAEDVVQEAWLRLEKHAIEPIENLPGWLRTVVARLCLDQLRGRKARREESIEQAGVPPMLAPEDSEREAQLADSVGLAMLVVLQNLSPAERVAFVMHDMFDLSFDEVGRVLGRSAVATRQLASRARRRVRGISPMPASDLAEQRRVVDAYLTAARQGDLNGLMAVLDPEVVIRMDQAAVAAGGVGELRGAADVARVAVAARARAASPALINGQIGLVVAPFGRLRLVVLMTFRGGAIAGIDIVADPARLAGLELGVLP